MRGLTIIHARLRHLGMLTSIFQTSSRKFLIKIQYKKGFIVEFINTKVIAKLKAISTAVLRPRNEEIRRTNINGNTQSRKTKYTRNMFLTDLL